MSKVFENLDYSVLFENDPNPILLIDGNDIIVGINNKAKELINSSNQNFTGLPLVNFIPDFYSKSIEKIQSEVILYHTSSHTYKIQIIKTSGSHRFVKLVPTNDENGHDDIIYGREKFETLTQLAPIGIYVVDLEGNNFFINKKLQELSGLTKEEAAGNGWLKAIYHEDLDAVLASWANLKDQKAPFNQEYRFINNKTNIIRDVLGLATELRNSKQEIVGYLGIVQDITVVKQLRETLEINNKTLSESITLQAAKLLTHQTMLSQACGMANLGYWELTLDPAININWSAEYKNIFEVDEKMESNDPRFFLQYTHPEDVEYLTKASREAIKSLGNTSYEYRIISASNDLKYLREQINTQSVNGKVTKVFGVTQDITYLKEAEIKLESSLAKEKDLNELKSKFISMASHEFRTPLTTILSSAELVGLYKENIDQEKIDKFTGRIISSVNDLRAILEDFLSLEKLESGNSRYEPHPTNFKEFVASTLLKVNTGQNKHEIYFEYKGLDKINIDPYLLNNVLINLLSNAKKYSPNNEKIDLIAKATSNRLSISIKDRGIGIPIEDQANMFTRFFRAGNVAGIKGTGLGLTIVKRYLSLMGGKINFTSEPGKGTTFTVNIPL